MNPSHDPEWTPKDEMKVEWNEDVMYVTIPKGERFPTRIVVQREHPYDSHKVHKEFFFPKR